jgi:hypothetical protein
MVRNRADESGFRKFILQPEPDPSKQIKYINFSRSQYQAEKEYNYTVNINNPKYEEL